MTNRGPVQLNEDQTKARLRETRMPENFQEDHTRSSEDADEAFERLMIKMKCLNSTMLRLEGALRMTSISFSFTRDAVLKLPTLK